MQLVYTTFVDKVQCSLVNSPQTLCKYCLQNRLEMNARVQNMVVELLWFDINMINMSGKGNLAWCVIYQNHSIISIIQRLFYLINADYMGFQIFSHFKYIVKNYFHCKWKLWQIVGSELSEGEHYSNHVMEMD